MAQKVLPLLWAAELAPHGITVMAVTPGFLRSESMLQHMGVTEDNWRVSDYDGRRPDWGRHKIDFSPPPPAWIDLFLTGADLEIAWLTTLAARTRKFRTKIPGRTKASPS